MTTPRKLAPLEDWVELQPKKYEPQKSPGGIVLPDWSAAGSHVPYFEAEVVAVGPDVKGCKVGDHVVLHREADTHAIDLDGIERILVREKGNIVALKVAGDEPPRIVVPEVVLQ